ncbi:Protein required for ethanol metabolism [Perkinsus chesapeaki]|uniref:Protein required for ethanol metabolism n=1 Tax=Perkinsus chesapeaki TaxID=330153 RepID=A0A7J6KVJ4_PERCH|nr:Protein required for ethanol metabolism [Perkinsus chesapeaki]
MAFSYPRLGARLRSSIKQIYAVSPMLANSVTSFTCYGLSDLIAQRAESNGTTDRKTDKCRVLSVALCGPLLSGVCLTQLYRVLDRVLGSGHSLKVASRKIIFMQVIYMPFSVPAFIFLSSSLNAFLKGQRPSVACSEAWESTRLRWKEAYWASWFVWPLSDSFNFTIVQKRMTSARPTWDGVIMVGWNAYLSWRGIGGHSLTEVFK